VTSEGSDLATHNRFAATQLRVTYQRIHEALDLMVNPVTEEHEAQWLARCEERERFANAAAPGTWALERLALSASETRVLWVLVAQELSITARGHLRSLATENDIDVTADVLRRVVYGTGTSQDVARELAPSGNLRRMCLIDSIDGDNVPAHRVAIRLSSRVLAMVHGELAIDDAIRCLIAGGDRVERSLSNLVVDEVAREQVRASIGRNDGILMVVGLAGSGRRSLLVAAAREAGYEVLTIDARKLNRDRELARRELRIISRECQVLSCRPLFINLEALQGAGDVPERVDLIESEVVGSILATASQPVARRWKRSARVIEMKPIKGSERATLWLQALPEASDGDAELLSTLYPLAPALIDAVGRVAVTEAAGEPLQPEHVSKGSAPSSTIVSPVSRSV
jgi:hypothetical protein